MDIVTNELLASNNGIDVYTYQVVDCIKNACIEFGYDDVFSISQRQWKSICSYIGDTLFGREFLYDKSNIYSVHSQNYNYGVIKDNLLPYYMKISDRYNKLISAEAFSLFIGINRDTIKDWGKYEPSSPQCAIFKIIKGERLECIKDNAYDSKNVVGTMFVGNVEYQTNMPGVHSNTENKQVSVLEIRGLLDKNRNTTKQLEDSEPM